MTALSAPAVAVVVIGRNEGLRLQACLSSVTAVGLAAVVVYVDSGSTDQSVSVAESMGCKVVKLDMKQAFTAARARNAGADLARSLCPWVTHFQFVDGDCELSLQWLAAALKFLQANPSVAVVCGRRRERYPTASIYNAMCDSEWNTPIGEAKACGGDALILRQAFESVEGFNPELIAGEEPDLCLRIRGVGWKVWRLDLEMTLHDAAIHHFHQYWNRSKRAGYAFAQGAVMHGHLPERHWVQETVRAIVWGLLIPIIILIMALLYGNLALLFFLIYPIQIMRLSKRSRNLKIATLTVVGKFAEAAGAVQFLCTYASRSRPKLIEYK